MLNFIDNFSLYRNIYRALIGFYIQNGAFTILKRKRRTNVFPLTIGPYSSNLDGIIQAIGSFLVQLDTRIIIDINSIEVIVCTILVYFIRDMLMML